MSYLRFKNWRILKILICLQKHTFKTKRISIANAIIIVFRLVKKASAPVETTRFCEYTYLFSSYISVYFDWLRAGRSGIESRWGRDFPTVHTGPGAHPASCKIGTRSFPGVKCGRGVLLTTHPLLVPRSWNSTAIPLPTLWATPGL